MTEDNRKMARVVTVDDVLNHDNADALEIAVIGGWRVVIKKGEFAKGDRVVFFEIDAALPVADPRFAFLEPRGVKTVNDAKAHVLKTAKLRGVVSQGLLLPADAFPEISDDPYWYEAVGVVKYEPPIPAQLAGQMKGNFYSKGDFRKTDAERVQNLAGVWDRIRENSWIATEKLDGSSASVIVEADGSVRMFSRNWELEPRPDLSLWQVLQRLDLTGLEGYQFQGELVGPGIQGNKLQLPDIGLRVFGAFKNFEFLPRSEWPNALLDIAVPQLDLELPATIDETVALADGMKSTVNPKVLAEGIVFMTDSPQSYLGDRAVFKSINNKWLLKGK